MIKVSEKLYRGPRPNSFKELQDAGITKVINLESGVYEYLHQDKYEFERAADFGIEVSAVPLSDIWPITRKQWEEIYHDILTHQGKVYVHCLKGQDRTGMVCAIYRMKAEGWSFESASAEMLHLGFNKWPYFWWIPFLVPYELVICE